MENQNQIELLQNNFLKIDKQEQETLEQAVSNFLVKNFVIDGDLAQITKKILKKGLLFISEDGEVSSRYNKKANIYISEKFLKKLLSFQKPKTELPKHLEDVLKERIENLLRFFKEAVEADKKSEYKILKDYASSLEKEILSKKELQNKELAKIMEYLNSRQAFFSNLENAKVFSNTDLKSSNKALAQTAKQIIQIINNPNMSLQEAQLISVYVMQRLQYDYVLSNSFSYAEKDLRESSSDKQRVQQAREILSILSKDQPSQEEMFKLAEYINKKEFESSIKIIEYLLEKESNEFEKNHLSDLLNKIKQNQEITMFDMSNLRTYYQSNVSSLLDQAKKALEKNPELELDSTIKEKLQKGGNFSVFELETIMEYLKSCDKQDYPKAKFQEERQAQQDARSQIQAYLEGLYKEANETTDPARIDQLFSTIDKIENKLREIESLEDEEKQEQHYQKLLDKLKNNKQI